MTTGLVPGHIQTAREFLSRSKDYLAQGDLHQAAEKGWGAAAHIAKAIAFTNGWEYDRHDQFDTVIRNAGQKYRQSNLWRYGDSAHGLHRFYYQHPSVLDADAIRDRTSDVEAMFNALVLSQPRNRKGLEAKGRTDGLGPSLRKSVWVIVIWRLTEY